MQTGIIVFDIGGTWFRNGVLTKAGNLECVTSQPALNYKNTPHSSITQLQEALVNYLVQETQRLQAKFLQENLQLVGISMGAALNAHTGLILNSGPLWGPECTPFDLLSSLQKRKPTIKWIIVNDITAALLRHTSEQKCSDIPRMALVTVSTGIGCRIWDQCSKRVPIDRTHGLQGEIGHIPITFTYNNHPIELSCDCGGLNHLNAFCSGRGIEQLLPLLATSWPRDFQSSLLSELNSKPAHLTFGDFAEAVRCEDKFAISLLGAVTFPLARVLIYLFTLDPEVEYLVLTGGVVRTLGTRYRKSLLSHLERIGLYQITKQDPSFFQKRIHLSIEDDNSGLLGAAIAAQLQVSSSPH